MIDRQKYVYRKGPGAAHGKTMQCIAGIHCNFSLPEESRCRAGRRHISERDYQSRLHRP